MRISCGAGPLEMAEHPHRAQPVTARLDQAPDDSRGTGPVPAAGSVLDDRYRLEALVGVGGTATVYRAIDLLLDRNVAIKVFHPHVTDPAMVARQRQEMQIVAALRHPNLILLHDARTGSSGTGQSGGPPGPAYLVLEFVDGPTLSERLQGPPLTPAEVARIGGGVAAALRAMHSRGLVHRDVKPGNILLTADDEAKLSDFGIARMLDADRVTNSADVVGTAPYLSPEQASSADVGPAADIYALGLVLLECLKGHREYPGPAVESAVARLLRDPAVPPDLPAGWSPLLASMTAFEPADRPPADDVVAVLRTLEVPTGPSTPAAGDRQRQRRVLVAAGAAVLVAGLTTAAVLSTGDPPPATTPPGADAPVASSAVPSGAASSAVDPTSISPTSISPTSISTAPMRTTAGRSTPAAAAPAPPPSAAPAPAQTRAGAAQKPRPAPAPQQTAPVGGANPGNGKGNNGGGNGNGGDNGNGGGNGNGGDNGQGNKGG